MHPRTREILDDERRTRAHFAAQDPYICTLFFPRRDGGEPMHFYLDLPLRRSAVDRLVADVMDVQAQARIFAITLSRPQPYIPDPPAGPWPEHTPGANFRAHRKREGARRVEW